MKNSTSSEAIGAFLSVLEYHGGLIKGTVFERSASGSSVSCLFLKKNDHLILSFQSIKSSSKAAEYGASLGLGLNVGPLERREMIPGEMLIGTSLRIRGLKLSVEKGSTVIGEDLTADGLDVEADVLTEAELDKDDDV